MTNGLSVSDITPLGERPADVWRGRTGTTGAGVFTIAGSAIAASPTTTGDTLVYDSATDTWVIVNDSTFGVPLTVEDEGTPLATAADTLNFVGAGVTATGTGGTKTITIPAAPAFATPAIVLGTAAAAGVAATVIRSDSTIVAFDATTPATQALGDAGATGSAVVAARRDHKHPMPALSTATPLVEAGSGAVGTGTASSREDHVHPAASGASSASDHEHVMDCLFSGDGSTTVWELPAAPVDAYSVAAYVAGVLTEISLSGTLLTTATFGSAPVSGTNNIRFDIAAAVT